MEKAAPHKRFIGAPGADGRCSCNMCPYMAMNSLEKLYLCLRDLAPRIEVPEDVRLRALLPLDRMLAISSGAPTDLTPAGMAAVSGD
jgi:quinolinate synthase